MQGATSGDEHDEDADNYEGHQEGELHHQQNLSVPSGSAGPNVSPTKKLNSLNIASPGVPLRSFDNGVANLDSLPTSRQRRTI